MNKSRDKIDARDQHYGTVADRFAEDMGEALPSGLIILNRKQCNIASLAKAAGVVSAAIYPAVREVLAEHPNLTAQAAFMKKYASLPVLGEGTVLGPDTLTGAEPTAETLGVIDRVS